MSIVALTTPPQSKLLSTVARIQERLAIVGDDARIAALLTAVSDEIPAYLGYGIARAEITESFIGSGFEDVVLSWAPMLSLGSVTLDGGAQTIPDFIAIHSPDGSVVRRSGKWTSTSLPDWSVRYWAGWLVRDDDFSGSISVDAADDSFNTTGLFPLLIPGDLITSSGFTNGANNGSFVVVSRTATKVIVAGALVTETSGTRTLACANLPLDIEQAAIEHVGELRSFGGAPGILTRESFEGISREYQVAGSAGGMKTTYQRLLSRRARVL